MKIELLERGIEVAPLQASLASHPQLWNEYTARTEDPGSPHHGLDDIWLRFAPERGERVAVAHDSMWYPSADLLGVVPLVEQLFERYCGQILGGVLITRIPAHRFCKPHVDHGWHARAYEKFAVQVHAAAGQRFCFDDESLETEPGDLFWFDNQYRHWVVNPTPHDRVTMIVCMKR